MENEIDKNKRYSNCRFFPKDYVVFDLEATSSSDYNYIIELCAFKVKKGRVIEHFESLVKPPKYRVLNKKTPNKRVQSFYHDGSEKIYFIEEIVENLTGINNKMIYHAKPELEVIQKFSSFIGDSILVGHGISNDINLLDDAFNRVLHKNLSNDVVDTFNMAFFLDGKEYSLVNLCNKFDIENQDIHRASSDAFRTYRCYERLILDLKNKYGNELNELYSKWIQSKEMKQCKYLKNKTQNKINKKNWSSLYRKYLDSGIFEDVAKKSRIVISKKGNKEETSKVESLAKSNGFIVQEHLSYNTNFYISSDEFDKKNINLKNKKLQKIIALNSLNSKIKILSRKDFIKIISVDGEKDRSIVNNYNIDSDFDDSNCNYEQKKRNDYVFEEKTIYIFNDFSTYIREDIRKEIKKKKIKIASKINYNIDYIVIGEYSEDTDATFMNSNEYKILISLLSFGCDIITFNESNFVKALKLDE